MSAHVKRPEVGLPSIITADDEWNRQLETPNLKVIDVYGKIVIYKAKWAGPCEPMQTIFKKSKQEYGEGILFIQAQTDYIEALKNFKDKSCPTFLLFFRDILVKIVLGANAPLLEKSIKEQMEIEKNGGVHKPVLCDSKSESQLVNTAEGGGTTAAEVEQLEKIAGAQDQPKPLTQAPSLAVLSDHYTETFALIKPDAMYPAHIERILDQIRLNRFHVMKKKKIWMSPALVEEFYQEHKEKPFFKSLVTYFTSGPCFAMVLAKDDAVSSWRTLIGPTNAKEAKEAAPESLRAYFGTDNRMNAVFGSDTQESADREIELVFGEGSKIMEMAMEEDDLSIKGSAGIQRTLCIIKSEDETVRADIIERIICRGITISKREELVIGVEALKRLFPTIVDDEIFNDFVEFYSKTSVLVLGLQGENVVKIWNEIAGPRNPEEAKERFPCSLRSLYGKNIVHNGVHASDTVESALYEVNIFFPHTLERRGTVVSDSRLGTNQNPYPAGYTASVEDLHSRLERTVALIKPDALQAGNKEAILKIIADKGYRIVAAKDVQMTPEQACEFYRDNSGKPWYDDLVSWISGSTVHALVLEKDSAVNSWRELIGPTSSEIAKSAAPHTLRAQFGTDSCKNAVHGSDSPSTVETEMKMLFGSEVSPDPEPLPSAEGEVEPVRASVIGRASVAKDAKDATKSAENILNMILAETKSQSNSKSKLSGSKGNLAGSKSNLGGSKSNLKSSGSKEQLKDKNPLGSKANLTGSKENLKSSGSKDNLKSSGSKDNLNSSGSKDNLNSSGSKEQLTDKKSSGSKVKIIESKDNLKTSGSNEKVKHAKENAAGSRATSAKSRPGSGLKKTADSKENVKKSSAALGSKNKLAASKKDVAAVPETSPEVAP